jgi:putative cell wall-binding protein
MDNNFAWYCTEAAVSANTSTKWSGTRYMNTTSIRYGTDWFTNINTAIGSAWRYTFSAWVWNGTFVAKVCGNSTMSISNPPCPWISGWAFNDLNGNGVADVGEPGRAGIPVTLYFNGLAVRSATTDAGGYYQFAIDANGGLTPGSYAVGFSAGESGWVTTRDFVGVWVAEGPGTAGHNFAYTNLGRRQIIPPVTTITPNPAAPTGLNGWYTGPLTATFSANQVATTRYALDAAAYSVWPGGPVTVPEGTHAVRYYSVNGFGDTEADRNASFKVDTAAPVNPVSVLSATESVPTSATEISAVWSGATDAVSGVEGISYSFSKDATALPDAVIDAPGSSGVLASGPLAEGVWYFNVRTRDVAGNWAEAVSYGPFVLDRTPPVTTLVAAPSTPDGAAGWYVSAPTVSLSVNETSSIFSATGVADLAPYAGPLALGEGVTDLSYRSIDPAGNAEATRTTTFKVDTGAPASISATWTAVDLHTVRVAWTASSDTVSGLSRYEVVDVGTGAALGTLAADATSTVVSGLDPRATYTIGVTPVDVAGNRGVQAVATFAIDNRAPITKLSSKPSVPDGLAGWYVTTPVVTLTPDEPAQTLYSIDGAVPETTYAAPFPLHDAVSVDVAYRSIDPAGNEEATKTAAFKVDTGAPAPVSATWAVSAMDAARITWTPSSDGVSGVGRYEVRDSKTGAVLLTCPAGATSAVLSGLNPDATYNVVVTPFDVAGNEGAPSGVVSFVLHWTDPNAENRWYPPGSNVSSTFDSSITVTYEHISHEGTVAVAPIDRAKAPGAGMFRLVRGPYWDVATSVTFDGWAYVTFPYDPAKLHGLEKNLKLFHWKNNGWEDVTWSIDYVHHTITGRTDSFSPFAIVEPLAAVTGTAGSDRYTTAVLTARRAYDPKGDRTWPTISHVVIASGEDRAAADPLAAAGLCNLYNAPLLLVKSGSVPAEVAAALKEIAANNGGSLKVHIVGGPASLPETRVTDIRRQVPGAAFDRVLSTGSRYDMAAAIAKRIFAEKAAKPTTVLGANGADPAKFFDALALSSVSAAKGFPILLVSANGVPAQTADALRTTGATEVIIGGGPRTVSDGVVASLNATRWAGADRYSTATTVAQRAIDRGWLTDDEVSIAAKLPDALTGGSATGKLGGVLLLTDPSHLPWSTGDWLSAPNRSVLHWAVIGGPTSVDASVRADLEKLLAR